MLPPFLLAEALFDPICPHHAAKGQGSPGRPDRTYKEEPGFSTGMTRPFAPAEGLVRTASNTNREGNRVDITVVEHPLARHYLTILRDKDTLPETFRDTTRRLCYLLLTEATARTPLAEGSVTTPLADTPGFRLDRQMVAVPCCGPDWVFSTRSPTCFPM